MARVLQLRRGDTTQNDNFTGLAGEITFDTDAKTIRVHDGQTLGGFPLARHDMGAGFDINSVPDTFWTELFATYVPNTNTITGIVPTIDAAAKYIEYIFATDATPIGAVAHLICQTPELGYSAGDEVAAFGIGEITACPPNIIPGDGATTVRLMTGGDAFWVYHNTSGERVNLTNENWGVILRLYC